MCLSPSLGKEQKIQISKQPSNLANSPSCYIDILWCHLLSHPSVEFCTLFFVPAYPCRIVTSSSSMHITNIYTFVSCCQYQHNTPRCRVPLHQPLLPSLVYSLHHRSVCLPRH